MPSSGSWRTLSLVSATATGWGDGNELSYPRFVDLRDNNRVFSDMFCRFGDVFHLGFAGQTERIAGELASGGYSPDSASTHGWAA